MREPVFNPGGLLKLTLVIGTVTAAAWLADLGKHLEARWGHWVFFAYMGLCGLAMWVQMTPEEKGDCRADIRGWRAWWVGRPNAVRRYLGRPFRSSEVLPPLDKQPRVERD